MDAEIWNKSKRGFPFNIPLELIVGVSFGTPLFLAFYLLDFKNQFIFDVLLKTLVLAGLGFIAANSLIPQFKSDLERKGLFGKDLNKAGNRDDKPPV
jgi:hypothetical protein